MSVGAGVGPMGLAADVERHARTFGVIVNAIGADVIRLAPPLVITDAQLDLAVAGLAIAIDLCLPRKRV